jgi:hypothetical protein
LRFLTIKIGLPVWREWDDPDTAFCRQWRAVKRLRCNTVAIEEELADSRPEPAAHQRVNFGETLALKDSGLARPFACAGAEHKAGEFLFVGVQRKIECAHRCSDLFAPSTTILRRWWK